MDIIEEQLNQIDDINNQITRYSKIRKKKKMLLKQYRFNLSLTRALPYLITTGIIASAFSVFGHVPFIIDRKKEYLNSKKSIDSEGNIRIEQFYDKKSNDLYNTVSYVSGWSKNGDMFERDVIMYDAHLYNEDELIRLVNTNENNISLDKLFKKVLSKTKEQVNNISEEELNNKGFVLITLYDPDTNEFRYIKEKHFSNFISTFLFLASSILTNFVVYNACSGNDLGLNRYQNRLEELDDKYPDINIDELKRKLEIRKANYQRLNR